MWQYRPTIQHAEFNTERRKQLAAKGQAMPDGGYPIRNVADLKNAIQAYGRATNKPAVKAWIKKRAKALGAEDLLPDNWRTDEIMHYGIKGQKWGVRRTDAQLGHDTGSSKKKSSSSNSTDRSKQIKRAVKIGAAAVATAAAVYGGYKFSRFVKDTNVKYHERIGADLVSTMQKGVARRKGVLLGQMSEQESKMKSNQARSAQYAAKKAAGRIRPGVEDTYGKMAQTNKQNLSRLSETYDSLSGRAQAAYENVMERERNRSLLDTPIDQLRNTYRYYKKK